MGENKGNFVFISAVVGLILLMVLPIPTIFLDSLLACNLALALTILIVSLYMKEPLEFSSFPALLLVSTLFRLTLKRLSSLVFTFHFMKGQELLCASFYS